MGKRETVIEFCGCAGMARSIVFPLLHAKFDLPQGACESEAAAPLSAASFYSQERTA